MKSNDELFPDVLPPAGSALITAETVSANLAAVREAAENFDAIAKSVLALEQQHPKALQLDLKVEANMAIAKAAHGAWREKRLALERSRKAAKAPVLALGRAVDGYAGQLEDSLRTGENNYKGQIEAREKEIAEEEAARVERHKNGIATIRGFLGRATGLPAARIQLGIDRLKEMKFGPEWEEFANQAFTAQQETLTALEKLLADTKSAELQEAERKRQAEEQEAERKRLAEQQAALDAQAAALAKQKTAMGDMQMMQEHVQAARAFTSLEEVQEIITGLTEWPVNEDLFGTMVPVVQMTKDAALLQLREVYRLLDMKLQEELQKRVADGEAREKAAAEAIERAVLPAAVPPQPTAPLAPAYLPAIQRAPADQSPKCEVVFVSPAYEQAVAQRQPAEEASLNIGQMVERLGFQITAEFVAETLKLPPRVVDRRAKLYYPSDFARVCDALVAHVQLVRDGNA